MTKEPNTKIRPVFDKNYITLATSSSNEYVKYLSVWFQSVIENASDTNNYDIIIFSDEISEGLKEKLLSQSSKKNISIRFFNPFEYETKLKITITHNNFNRACYFRLFAPLVLEHSKVLFTDCDLCFIKDPYLITKVDIENIPGAACTDPIWVKVIENRRPLVKTPDSIKYAKETLKLRDVRKYFNTGVFYMNLDEFRKNDYYSVIKKAIDDNFFVFQEQCAINAVLNEQIKVLEEGWNTLVYEEVPDYVNADTKVIHFPGLEKPWLYPSIKHADIWWSYARRTPFYEEILVRIMDLKAPSHPEFRNLYMTIHPFYFLLKKWRYRLLTHLTFGKKKEKYTKKYTTLKAKIKEQKEFVKQMEGVLK
ncbi:MAG: hypothetical protein MJ170_02505 [Alphaproteobacteria bacterium]|nr:hypothetical protein [Alphaproteobacteria bacterium]